MPDLGNRKRKIIRVVIVLAAIIAVFALLKGGYLSFIGKAVMDWAFSHFGLPQTD